MVSRDVTIVNDRGLHARAAAKCVELASRFASHIKIARGAREMDGKSIMGILLLAAPRGTQLRISADGPDEVEAVRALSELFESGFLEDS